MEKPVIQLGVQLKYSFTLDGFAAEIPSGKFKIYSDNFIKSVAHKDSIFQEASLDKIVGICIGKKQTVDEIKANIAQARNKLLLTYKKYAKDEELYKPMQNVLAWDVIYEPTHYRVIAPVSRIWSVDAKGRHYRKLGGYKRHL